MPPMTLRNIQETTRETCRGLFLKKGSKLKKPGEINWNALIIPKSNPNNNDIMERNIKITPTSFFIDYLFEK